MTKAAIYTILFLMLVLAIGIATAAEKHAFNGLSIDTIKIDPEQTNICDFMRRMAYDIQQERRTQDLDEFPASDSDTINEVAKWVYERFTKHVTPDEVGFGMNSDCVGLFQNANKNRLKVNLKSDFKQRGESHA